jgi:hypothetical protein
VSAAARAAQLPIASGDQGGMSRARQTGSSHRDHRDHISTGRDDAATATQRRQETENSPATTGEFNRTLNTAVNEVQQLHTVEETSSVYARRRAAQEQLSQSAPTLHERVKSEPAAPPLVDSAYACGQRGRDEFRDRVVLQRLRLSDLQADGHTPVPDQGVIFDQNGIP